MSKVSDKRIRCKTATYLLWLRQMLHSGYGVVLHGPIPRNPHRPFD